MSTQQKPAQAARPDKAVRVGELLLDRGLITREQLEQALMFQKENGHKRLFGEVVVDLKFVTDEQVLETLASVYGVPFARISPKVADPKIIEVLPRDFLEKQCVVPLFVVNGKLTIAVHEPTNVFLIEEIERLANCPVQIVAATTRDITSTLQ